MKKITSLIAAALMTLSLSGAAHALTKSNNWTLDLSTWGSGTYTNIDRLSIDGQSTVVQKFSNPFNLQNGDTFTESGLLSYTGYYKETATGVFESFSLGAGKRLYVELLGLTGSVNNVTGAGFDYTFNPGIGTIKMYLDTDTNSGNGVIATLANLTLLNPSGGHNNGVLLGGAGVNGTTDLTGLFSSVLPGVFFADGLDFGNLPAGYQAFGLANTNNLLDSQSIISADSAELIFNSAGQFNVATVPEPGTFALLGVGLFGLVVAAKRRSKV